VLKCTSNKFIMILSLLEVIIPDLCLFSIKIVWLKIRTGYSCVCWFLKLVLDQSMCERKFGFISVIFVLLCINPLFVN
jgi:uncharacterized membrane protein YGL010W